MPKSLKELIEHADRYADAFEAAEVHGDEASPPAPELALQLAVFRRAQAEKDVAAAVAAARAVDISWARIGDTLGTSGEAARQRYTSA